MKVSIIIATRNRADSLRETLASLQSIDVPVSLHPEILVVDNGSGNDARDVAQQFRTEFPLRPTGIDVSYAREPVTGQSRARNTGLACSNSDIALFTDDDLQFPKNWLETMCAPIADKKTDAVAGSVEIPEYLLRPWMTLTHRSWLASTERLDPVEPSDMVGANMAFSRSVLDRVPAFDPELGPGALGYYDDGLFSFQLKKAGFKVRRSSGLPALHHFSKDRLLRGNWLAMAKKMGRSCAYVDYHWRHTEVPRAVIPRRLARRGLAYCANRIIKWRDCQNKEGMAEWEMRQVQYIHYLMGCTVENKRPRNYSKEGLVKMRTVATIRIP